MIFRRLPSPLGRNGFRLAAAGLLILSLWRPGILLAHPHVFIEQRLTLVFDDAGFMGIHVNWRFDDMFSSMIAADHDKNKNQSLEPEEVSDIKANAFSYISHYHYFFTITVGGKPFEVRHVTDFTASLERGQLFYEFFIPCEVAAGAEGARRLKIASYDPEYYTAIRFSGEQPWELANGERFTINAAVREDKETLIYFDMVNPWTLFLEFEQQ